MSKEKGEKQLGTEDKPKARDYHREVSVARSLYRDVTVFGNLRVLCFAAMLAAMSVILAYFAKLVFGPRPVRVTLENFPIIFGGISFGPFVGAMIAIVTDLCSCLLSGQAPNPLIFIGSIAVGLVSGFLGGYVFRKRSYTSLLFIELITHVIGTITLKSLALWLYFGYTWLALLPRVPLYLAIAALEAYLLLVVCRSKQITTLTERIKQQ